MRQNLLLVAALLAVAITFPASAKEDEANEAVDPNYTWDLTELYPTVETWSQAREEVMADFDNAASSRAKPRSSIGARNAR